MNKQSFRVASQLLGKSDKKVCGIKRQHTLLHQVQNLDKYIDSVPFYCASTLGLLEA